MTDNDVIRSDERAIFRLRELYRRYGYKQYRMSKFEEYELYASNKDFLVSDGIITFNDTNGRLMALKPDVTLSIIKNSKDSCLSKVYYNENVYRVSEGTHSFKEIMQTGLECMGNIDIYNICEVVMLAASSLAAIDKDYRLDISHMGFLSALLSATGAEGETRKQLIACISGKNMHEAKKICEENGLDCKNIELLISTYGSGGKVLESLKNADLTDEMKEELKELCTVNEFLTESGLSDKVNFDFSIVNDMSYYSGIVFKGYINGIFKSVLSGGQYDGLMEKMGRHSGAIGFAVYLDGLQRLDKSEKRYDVDILLLYEGGADASALSKSVKMLTSGGNSVFAAKTPGDIKYRQLVKFNGEGVVVLETND